jgi:hypothetical protein
MNINAIELNLIKAKDVSERTQKRHRTTSGNVLFSDPVRLLGMELICTGALYPLLRKLTE